MNQKVKQFSIKILLLFFLSWGTVEAFYQFNPFQKHDLATSYNATIIEKYQRLESLPSPKVVLIAGSNFAYGINSEMIEKTLHKPVINMAMHYDYGTDFMLKQITPELHKGDIVIMGFEYIIESKGNKSEQLTMARFYPKANEWIQYKDIFEYIGDYSQLRVNNFKTVLERLYKKQKITYSIDDTTNVFFRGAINKYGDLVSHFNNTPFKVIPKSLLSDKTSMKKPIADMNLFYQQMKKIGVKVFFVYPTYAASSYQVDKAIIDKFEKEYQQNAQFPILGKPTDFVFDDSLYHDMAYHHTQKGGDIRTQKLLYLLLKVEKQL